MNVHIVESSKSVDEVAQALPEVVQRHKFGVLGSHNLKQKMNEKGVPFEKECRVFDVCNPVKANKVLSVKMEISTVLPCRISVYEEDGKARIACVPPPVLLGMFGAPELKGEAEEVERTMLAIMREAA